MATYLVPDLADVATFFGIAYDTCKNWKRNGMPGGEHRYDLSAIARWRLARDRRPRSTDLAQEEKRLSLVTKRLDIEARQRKAEVEKGALLDRGQVESHLGLMLNEFQQSLMAIGQALPHAEDRKEAERRIRLCLEELRAKVSAMAPQAEKIAKIVAGAASRKPSDRSKTLDQPHFAAKGDIPS